jgi:dTDP-4-dehydrorhamnose reductase
MKKRILITGSNGLLGQKLVHLLLRRDDFLIFACSKGANRISEKNGYTYFELDISSEEEVKKIMSDLKPDVIINTAAMTNVDACELNPAECRKINVDAVSYFIDAINILKNEHHLDPHFIHLSTDFVFDGTDGPYAEDDKPNPLSIYARSKYDSEQLLINSKIKWAIARTIIVYGVAEEMSRSNVVLWVKSALEKGEQIKIVDDQFRMPTLAEDLAEGCLQIADRNATGIFHLSGKDFMSILELAHRVADFFNLDKSLISPSKSSDIKQPAKRPPRTGFILDKPVRELNYNPHSFEEGLGVIAKQLG